ncbi:apolipoprotein acyltransferase [Actibacterium mucosum]|uniref:apolipoprotein acyltransferase n=1 Tax=Actibacterium mucosum TaxID=1087332 RepID=UPI0009DCD891|nr:apolipoprotein acyltransferase [Actibacterium mucosum]
MIFLPLAAIGAIYGALQARRRKGNGFDIAQFAIGYAIAFGLIGLLATVVLDRMF